MWEKAASWELNVFLVAFIGMDMFRNVAKSISMDTGQVYFHGYWIGCVSLLTMLSFGFIWFISCHFEDETAMWDPFLTNLTF